MKIVYIAIALVFSTSGCGTLLSISETNTNTEHPDALVINRRAAYSVKFLIPSNSPLKKIAEIKHKTKSINGVDHDRLLTLDVNRMPFASGKLAVTLNGSQLLKKVELTSETGADRAIDAAKSGFDARTSIEKAKKEAKEAAAKE